MAIVPENNNIMKGLDLVLWDVFHTSARWQPLANTFSDSFENSHSCSVNIFKIKKQVFFFLLYSLGHFPHIDHLSCFQEVPAGPKDGYHLGDAKP